MNNRQYLNSASLDRCALSLRDPALRHPSLVPLRKELDDVIAEIRDLGRRQMANNHVGADGREIKIFRNQVRKNLLRISHLAIAILAGLPGIEDDMRVPHANASTDDLLEAKDRILKVLKPHMKTLHKKGLPKETIPDIEKTAKLLAAKLESPDTYIARRSRATSSLPDAFKRARKIVKALDTSVRLEFADDAAALGRWAGAVRVGKRIGRPPRKNRKPKPSES